MAGAVQAEATVAQAGEAVALASGAAVAALTRAAGARYKEVLTSHPMAANQVGNRYQ